MEATVAADVQLTVLVSALAEDLHQFLSSVQNSRKQDPAWMEKARLRCEELAEKVTRAREAALTARESWRARMEDARDRAAEMREGLSESLERMRSALNRTSGELTRRPSGKRWKEMYTAMGERYEEVMAHVRRMRDPITDTKIQVTTLKPKNIWRNVLHVGMGLGAVLWWELALTWTTTMWILGLLSAFALTLEISRRFSERWNSMLMEFPLFRYTSRPREKHRINSATVYLLALTLMAFIAPMPAVEIGLLVLAFADPAASLIGKRWGTHRIYAQKTVEGCCAFFVTALVVTTAFIAIKGGFGLSLPMTVGLVMTASLAGTVVETMSGRLDDNFTVMATTTGFAALFFF